MGKKVIGLLVGLLLVGILSGTALAGREWIDLPTATGREWFDAPSAKPGIGR